MRNFVLVTATATDRRWYITTGNGITKLKRGMTLKDMATSYLSKITGDYELLERDDSIVAIQHTEEKVFTWTFTVYREDDLFTAVSHLTREELWRDLKELLPLKGTK